MVEEQSVSPKITSILIGVLLFIVLLVAFLSLGDILKYAGAPFLFLPCKLGMVEEVSSNEVVSFRLESRQTSLKFAAPGHYVLYTADYDLLTISDEIGISGSPPWLNINNTAAGEAVEVVYVNRGLRMYDSVLARGRPIYRFLIENPGVYTLDYPTRKAQVSILPDATFGKETMLFLAYALQIGVILAPLGFLYYRRRRRNIRRIREIRKLKTIRGSVFQKDVQKNPADEKKPGRDSK